jgi:hypothetical protein
MTKFFSWLRTFFIVTVAILFAVAVAKAATNIGDNIFTDGTISGSSLSGNFHGTWSGLSTTTLPYTVNSLAHGYIFAGNGVGRAAATSTIFLQGGYVGIGTTNPNSKFQISGDRLVANVSQTYLGLSGYEAHHANLVVMIGGGTSIVDATNVPAVSPNLWGIVSSPRLAITSAGVTTAAAIFSDGPSTQSDSPGNSRTITNLDGMLIENPGSSMSADITADNVNGLEIKAPTGGTANYALKSWGTVYIVGNPLLGTSYYTSGPLPASAGALRFSSSDASLRTITARNAANTSDLTIADWNYDQLQLGAGTSFIKFNAPSAFVLGSSTVPSFSFSGDTNTGIYSPSADNLSVVTGGTNRMIIDSSGNVGIGTTNPQTNLEIYGGHQYLTGNQTANPFTLAYPTNLYGDISRNDSTTGGLSLVGLSSGSSGQPFTIKGYFGNGLPTTGNVAVRFIAAKSNGSTWITDLAAGDIAFQSLNNNTPLMTTLGNGNFGIGTTTPASILHVAAQTGTSTITIGDTDTTPSCIKMVDAANKHNYGYCRMLSGSLVCNTDPCDQ